MLDNLKTFNEAGINIPVILGGAALTPKFVNSDCQNAYNGQVIYGRDAFTDLRFMDAYMTAKVSKKWENNTGFLDEVNQEFFNLTTSLKCNSQSNTKDKQSDLNKQIVQLNKPTLF